MEKTKSNIDRAWEKLHTRLEEDGLLDTPARKIQFWNTDVFQIGACACVIFAVVLFTIDFSEGKKDAPYTSVANIEKTTLVTTLEDGSTVYLNEDSQMSCPDHFEKNKRQISINGEAFFDIEKSPGRPFFIDAQSVLVEVVGTAFDIKNRNGDFMLAVKRGEVKVSVKSNEQVVSVKAGEMICLKDNHLEKVQYNDAAMFNSYFDQMHFKDEKLLDIVNVLNEHYIGDKINVATSLENRVLTVTFDRDSLINMAQLICTALNLSYVERNGQIFISELN